MNKVFESFLEENKDIVVEKLSKGLRVKYLAKELDIKAKYIYEFCKKNDIHYKGKSIKQRDVCHKTNAGKVWTEEDADILIKNYPNLSLEDILKLLPEYTKVEINYMSSKLKLRKTEERDHQRRIENNNRYKIKIKIENDIEAMIFQCEGDVHKAVEVFKQSRNYYSSKKIYDFLVLKKYVDPSFWFLYLDIYCPLNYTLTYEETFLLYKYYLDKGDDMLPISFDKEATKKLFIYWSKITGFDLSRESLLSIKNFRKIFILSKLEQSIRNNYAYTYNFIADLLDDPSLKPHHLSIQVPNKYWDNIKNVFYAIEEGINKMLLEGIIEKPEEIMLIDNLTLLEYFPMTMICKGAKGKLRQYLIAKNIQFNEKKLPVYNNILFDSLEELYVYKKIKSWGFNIEKCRRKDRYYNEDCNEYYIPDFKIIIDEKEYISEYFGLYTNRYEGKKISEYKKRADRKMKYFFDNYNFIPIMPEDRANGAIAIFEKIQERRKLE